MTVRHRTLTCVLALGLVVLGATTGRALAEEQSGADTDRAVEAAPPAAEKDWSLDLDLTYNSKYVWRSIQVTPDPVLQPAVTVGYKGLSLNVWANMDTTDVHSNENQFNEIDYTLDYSFDWDKVTVSVGAIHYMFPQLHVADTTEAYVGIGLKVPASPKLTVYQDLDEHDGTYLALAFGHTFEDVWKPTKDIRMGVDLGVTFAWGSRKHNQFYYGAGAGWADTTVHLGLPLKIGEHVTITPAVNYMWLLDDGITESLGDGNAFWAGVTFRYSF
jgi:hypothetical protein